MQKIIETNQATIIGAVDSTFEYSHEVFGEKYYTLHVLANRLSGEYDRIPLTISERLIDITQDYSGEIIKVTGQLRSYNKHISETKSKLIISVFVRDLEFMDEQPDATNSNTIILDGYLCKNPIYRKTPLGREIADVLLAVNRPYGKSDYIPSITWGRDAKYISSMGIGTRVKVIGRLQSREYIKKLTDTEEEKRTVYELSISRLEVVDDYES